MLELKTYLYSFYLRVFYTTGWVRLHKIRQLAISIGDDSDTISSIAGEIAAAYYKEIAQEMIEFAESKLPNEFIEVLNKFDEKYKTV